MIYNGWNPIAEYTIQNSTLNIQNSYLWGLDLSGTLQGAGGVGGLLALRTHNPQSAIYYPSFDGNGNIIAWTQSGTSAPVCLREYDAFGNVLVEQGTPPCAIGFSTKLEDPETGLLYYGHRYYDPITGRWPSMDPIEEEGGMNLYEFVGNDGVNYVDGDGLEAFSIETDHENRSDTFKIFGFSFTLGGPKCNYNANPFFPRPPVRSPALSTAFTPKAIS
jgi:RHS repeat-associated protein